MKKCPGCGTEYDDGQEKCPNCSWLVLTTVSNDIEFGIVAGILEMGNIPCIRKVRGIDGFIQVVLGVPIQGIDVLVHEDKFEEAYGLLHSSIEEEQELPDNDEGKGGK